MTLAAPPRSELQLKKVDLSENTSEKGKAGFFPTFHSLTVSQTDVQKNPLRHQTHQKVVKHGSPLAMRLERAEAQRENRYLQRKMAETATGGRAPTAPQRRHLLSHDFLLVMKPEICRGSRPSVATAISSWPRESQKSSRLFKSVSTSAKSGSCNRRDPFFSVAKQKETCRAAIRGASLNPLQKNTASCGFFMK